MITTCAHTAALATAFVPSMISLAPVKRMRTRWSVNLSILSEYQKWKYYLFLGPHCVETVETGLKWANVAPKPDGSNVSPKSDGISWRSLFSREVTVLVY